MRVRIHIAYGMIAATYIVTICSILFGCHPMHKNWQIYPDPGSECEGKIHSIRDTRCLTSRNRTDYCQPAVSKLDIYVTVVLNVVTDIYLISIPAPVCLFALCTIYYDGKLTKNVAQMLFKARLHWREKLELLVLFSGGLFVMMAGILRCVLILTVRLPFLFLLIFEFSSNTEVSRLVPMVPSKLAAGPVVKPSSLWSLAMFR